MRIFAWNVNHRTYRKLIPNDLPAGILSLAPDVVVLTEYVEALDHTALCTALEAGGLTTLFCTPFVARHNRVLLASRSIGALGAIAAPDNLPHTASTFLHVRLADPPLDLIGLRVPMFKRAVERHCYWDWFVSAIQPLFACRAVIIGDVSADHLRRLSAAGWQLPIPAGLWSYISAKGVTSRLDHAPVAPSVTVTAAQYIASAHGYLFAGPERAYPSDHAPLLLDCGPLEQISR